MRSVALVVVVIVAMVIAVVIMIPVVSVPMAVMPAEIDDDCRFTVAMAVLPVAIDLDDAAADLCRSHPRTGNCIRGNRKNAAESECR